MSAAIRCDGCHESMVGREISGQWVHAEVRDARNAVIAKGDFHTADCLARFLASDKLDQAIKKGQA